MAIENEQAIKDLVWGIRRLVKAVHVDTDKISKRYGLTGPQIAILRILDHRGPMSSADLSRKLFVTPSNITGIIDRLEKKELVERIRKPRDRRVALITLTEKGTDLSKTLPDPIENRLIAELADIDPGEVADLREAMQKILKLMGTTIGEAPLMEFSTFPNGTAG